MYLDAYNYYKQRSSNILSSTMLLESGKVDISWWLKGQAGHKVTVLLSKVRFQKKKRKKEKRKTFLRWFMAKLFVQ